MTTMFRGDGISIVEDQEVIDVVNAVHWGRTFGGFKSVNRDGE